MNPIRIAKNWMSYRRTMNELGNLSNHTLSDIGLTRHDIRDIASRSFRLDIAGFRRCGRKRRRARNASNGTIWCRF